MKKLLAILITIGCLVAASAVGAQTRTWVSGVGSDANPCSRTAPCQTFSGALSKTAAAGEINCLDPGGFGTVNITKSITIDCGNTHGSILAASTNGVIVNAANIVVTLRGLSINGAGTTTGNGVRILNAAAVNIDDVVIENFGGAAPSNGRGISIETAGTVRVTVQNSSLYNINNIGIHANPSAGAVTLDIDNVSINRTIGSPVQIRQLTTAMINELSATNSASAGVVLELTTATATISNSLVANNLHGIQVGNGGSPTVRLYASTVSGNVVNGLLITSGQIRSMGNNMIFGNGGNETPSANDGTR